MNMRVNFCVPNHEHLKSISQYGFEYYDLGVHKNEDLYIFLGEVGAGPQKQLGLEKTGDKFWRKYHYQ